MRGIRRPLLLIALLLALAKSAEFAIDPVPTFCVDSGAFVVNALRIAVIAERSYLYGFLIRAFALPFHSLPAILVMQLVMSGISGWLLGFVLLRYFKVRPWIAILASLLFAIDPAQVMDEHMVMTETPAMLAMALFLTVACGYLESPAPWRLVVLAFIGALLVGMRIVFLPPVVATVVLLPLGSRKVRQRSLALALAVSCASTLLFQEGYRHLTGYLAGREAAYHYVTGFFLVSAVAPLVEERFAPDAITARAIDEQNKTEFPLKNVGFRSRQLWQPDGLVARLKQAYRGDFRQANDAANRVARAAILHHPIGFLKLGGITYADYWLHLRHLKASLPWEIGTTKEARLLPSDTVLIAQNFYADVSRNWLLQTPARRYYLRGRAWHIFLLFSPLLAGLTWWRSAPDNELPLLFFVWSLLLVAATCLGAVESVYRYLHPFSFIGLIAAAVLVERRCAVLAASRIVRQRAVKSGAANANNDFSTSR